MHFLCCLGANMYHTAYCYAGVICLEMLCAACLFLSVLLELRYLWPGFHLHKIKKCLNVLLNFLFFSQSAVLLFMLFLCCLFWAISYVPIHCMLVTTACMKRIRQNKIKIETTNSSNVISMFLSM